ncbi:hypothetical protein V1281_001966 [Nitrobacteraceae bacterium AZCC 2161]
MPVATQRTLTIRHFAAVLPAAATPPIYADQQAPDSPLIWWRTRAPTEFDAKDSVMLRRVLNGTIIVEEPNWPRAVAGQVTTAIWIAVDQLKKQEIAHLEIDLALSALLACAIDGDVTAEILISSALRRRGTIEPACRFLGDLWLISDLSHNTRGRNVN